MTSWLDGLVTTGVAPAVRDGIWRWHPQEQRDDFLAEFLPSNFLKGLARAGELGWRRSIEAGLPLLPAWIADYTRDYFLEPYRADFVDELGLREGSTVLDLGCGWGFASQRALERGARVVGTDTALRRLQFCVTRFAQQGWADRFVGLELDANGAFPFRPASFDAVIVSGLLEWVACSAEGDPEALQRRFMEKVRDLVAPGGRLYLAIENRYWGRYFVGARDLHRIHRLQVLTSLLPRALARPFCRLVTGQDYRTYTYSLSAYLDWLADLGYRSVTVRYPIPDYVQPKRVHTLLTDLDLTAPADARRRAARAQRPHRLRSLFGRSFMFFATR